MQFAVKKENFELVFYWEYYGIQPATVQQHVKCERVEIKIDKWE